jgi:hypothetical protein
MTVFPKSRLFPQPARTRHCFGRRGRGQRLCEMVARSVGLCAAGSRWRGRRTSPSLAGHHERALRRVSPVAAYAGEGLLLQATAEAQPPRWGPPFMPLSGRSLPQDFSGFPGSSRPPAEETSGPACAWRGFDALFRPWLCIRAAHRKATGPERLVLDRQRKPKDRAMGLVRHCR